MKALNDIALQLALNWIEYAFELKFGQLDPNWIEKKWNADWRRVYWKYILEYGVAKSFFLINTNSKGHLSMPLLLNGLSNSSLELFKWEPLLMKSKIVLSKPTPMIHCH
jgi:hypothetical protein